MQHSWVQGNSNFRHVCLRALHSLYALCTALPMFLSPFNASSYTSPKFPRIFASQKCSWADNCYPGGFSIDVVVHVRLSESLMHREGHHLNLSVQGNFGSGISGGFTVSNPISNPVSNPVSRSCLITARATLPPGQPPAAHSSSLWAAISFARISAPNAVRFRRHNSTIRRSSWHSISRAPLPFTTPNR